MRKGAPDDMEARPGPTIVMRRTGGMLQTPAYDEGLSRKASTLSPGCYRDARFWPTIEMRRAGGVAASRTLGLIRSGCPDQRCEAGPLYRQGSSRRRLLAATMEVKGISLEGNACASCGKRNNIVMGLTRCLLNAIQGGKKVKVK